LTRPTAVPGLTFRDVDENVLVHEAKSDMIHVLNNSAGYILRLADGTRNADDLARDFAEQYCIERERARVDVEVAVAEFRRLGLLTDANVGPE
jgi:hypothetical protein